jgi:myo-inositol 2-dehydrogenase/D-chiro-inositol 1-dehydrogenase
VNYIILATPPGFRPIHLAAAIAANKNIFTEKPVAVDGPGIRAVLEAYEQSKAKGLGIGAGTQRRHQTGYLETMKRIQDGAIGKILSARCYWNQGGLWKKDRQPEWTDAEWQLRNWLYFTWLSGDHIVEQHVHNIDVINWAMDGHPVSANGMGGRQVRTSPDYGHIFDHFAIDYEYANGTPLASQCRQIQGCANNVTEALVGEKGTCQLDNGGKYSIAGAKAWKFEGQDNRPYVQEHTDFIASIRAGKPYNELKTVAESTMTAIMGRMSAYTGKVVTWEQALNSKEELMPRGLTLGPLPTPAVAVPGQTQLI